MPQPPAAHTTPHAGGLARTPVVRPLVPSLASAVLLAALAPAGAALAQTMPAATGADRSAWRPSSPPSRNHPPPGPGTPPRRPPAAATARTPAAATRSTAT